MSKVVRIVETGEVLRSAADCAALLGVSVGMVVHCLKGRRKTVAGCTVVYEPMKVFKNPKPHSVRRIIFDTNGKWYESFVAIGMIHKISRQKARTMTMKNGGVFPVPAKHTGDLFR